ncbi:MAG: hypothetical protein ACTHXA_11570 [Gulosibacter sp.]|uniref:HNH endonuclease signature motif containing protein n=1 Tax=Gulosibacter sp. TaxID=2817531 RepID=UPI003F8DF3A8
MSTPEHGMNGNEAEDQPDFEGQQDAGGHWPHCALGNEDSASGTIGTAAGAFDAARSDFLGDAELEAAVAGFRARKADHGALIAADLVDLSTAYVVAEKRAEADRKDRMKRPYLKNADYLSWHLRSIAGEFSIPCHESDSTLQWLAFEAYELVHVYPDWFEAIRTGRVRLQHARAFLRDTRALDAIHLPALAERALAFAEKHTVSETHRFVEREVATLAAENFEAAHTGALEERCVTITHEGLGMSTIHATVATEIAIGIDKQLTLDARTIQEGNKLDAAAHTAAVRAAQASGADVPAEIAPDKRTVAQIRADLLTEMLLCGDPESIARAETSGASRATATVNIVVPALSILQGRKDESQPVLADGMIPIGFDQARQIAATAKSWQRVLTDPITGHTLCVDTYRPDASMRRFLQVRDNTCRFPGCARAAAGCDIDHTKPYSQGGKTCECNTAHLCRGHHVQKHQRRWAMRQLGGGVIEWITPLGQRAVTEPEPIGPVFVPKAELARDKRTILLASVQEEPPQNTPQENSGSGPETQPPPPF